jgi:hypothetical protein
MRTTIRLDDRILDQAKRHARETQRTLTDLVRDALVATLERERGAQSPRRIRLTTVKGHGPCDGVDLDRSAALRDRMERSD